MQAKPFVQRSQRIHLCAAWLRTRRPNYIG
jgi:hypothetical protein